ncbi:MAG: patatin-like phospholipase family protein [Actinobacteria bacterium]|nr:patatin-like phospholipase family protein [Actinomycetota bacterium]
MAATAVGLVLGAGGVVGQAYHAGVLAALENDLGWDARTADLLVGSSAGSVTSTLLRLGVPASDLAAWAVEAPLSPDLEPLLRHVARDQVDDFPALRARDLMRGWRVPSPALFARVARRPWALRPMVIAATMAPTGCVDIAERAELLRLLGAGSWPEGLLVCATRRSDGRRVVFGREGAPPAGCCSAVAASCAIPGYFCPVTIGGTEYIDGGVHSPTNADVLSGRGLDLVIVVSPMSAARGRVRSADAPLRWSAHRRLAREVARLRAEGTTVVRFEPDQRCLGVMGLNAMDRSRVAAVVQQAFLETGRHLRHPGVLERLSSVDVRAARRKAALAA